MSLWCRLCLKIFLPRWYSCSCCNFQNTSGWLLSLFFPWSLAFTWTSTFALLWKWYSLYYYKQVVIKNWPANKGKKAPITSFPPLPPFSWKPHILLSTCSLSQKTKLSEVSFLLCLAFLIMSPQGLLHCWSLNDKILTMYFVIQIWDLRL